MNTLLTPQELGELYKVSADTIRAWHKQGRIPAEVAVNKILRFDPEAVAAALKADAEKQAKFKRRISLT
jgi:predicted site-specific integrase-resolvase